MSRAVLFEDGRLSPRELVERVRDALPKEALYLRQEIEREAIDLDVKVGGGWPEGGPVSETEAIAAIQAKGNRAAEMMAEAAVDLWREIGALRAAAEMIERMGRDTRSKAAGSLFRTGGMDRYCYEHDADYLCLSDRAPCPICDPEGGSLLLSKRPPVRPKLPEPGPWIPVPSSDDPRGYMRRWSGLRLEISVHNRDEVELYSVDVRVLSDSGPDQMEHICDEVSSLKVAKIRATRAARQILESM